MIVEQRIYTIQIGKTAEFLATYGKFGLAVQRRHLGNLVGHYYNEIGPLNTVTHMWAYEDLNDRAERRAKLYADTDWQACMSHTRGFVVAQESRLMNPSPFFEDMLRAMLDAARKV